MQLFHDPSKIGECEFWLISEMSSNLIVHQPYRALTGLQSNLNLTQDEMALSWSIINDHYMTDLPLLYPPHTVALMAILLAIVFRPSQNATQGAGPAAQGAAAAAGASMAQPSMAGINAVTAALAQAQVRQQQHQQQQQQPPPPTPGSAAAAPPPPGQAPADGMSAAQAAAMSKEKGERYGKMQRFGLWLAESNIDIEAMVDCTQELISFYDFQEQYNDKLTREQVVRFIKARGLDKG